MRKLLMYVYGDITTDARVNRAACALAKSYDVTLISTNCGKLENDTDYKNILICSSGIGIQKLVNNIWETYKIVKASKPDILYCHDYYSSLLAFICLNRRHCKKIIYDAHELIIPEPGLKDKRQYFFYWFEKRIIKKVDLVICASKERCEQMVNHYGLKVVPTVIRNISQLTIGKDEQTREIMNSLENFFLTPEPTVVYAGAVMKSRRIQELAKAVAELAPKFKLLIVGKGDAIEPIKEIASTNPEMKVHFTGAVPYKCLGAILSKCDMGFVYYPTNTLNNRFCASNKVYEYASVGLSMISNENPTIKAELEENHLGLATSDLMQGLRALSEDIISYKQSCIKYTKENPWSNDERLLLNSVKNIQ